MRMKRTLACLAIAGIFLSAGLFAFSVLPHSHGGDLDHSKHPNCPVHQFSLAHVHAAAAETIVLAALFIFLWLVSLETGRVTSLNARFLSSRAPPTVS